MLEFVANKSNWIKAPVLCLSHFHPNRRHQTAAAEHTKYLQGGHLTDIGAQQLFCILLLSSALHAPQLRIGAACCCSSRKWPKPHQQLESDRKFRFFGGNLWSLDWVAKYIHHGTISLPN
jgi:hypothetical protein